MALATGAKAPDELPAPTPAVSIRQSIKPDYLICLDDGKKFKSLRRHIAGLGMTPEQYRAKWNLPADYPMVAANYAAQRSELAKSFGLGQLRKSAGVWPRRSDASELNTFGTAILAGRYKDFEKRPASTIQADAPPVNSRRFT